MQRMKNLSLKMLPRLAALLLALFVAACDTEVYRGLTQNDANEMVAVLARASIPAKRELTDGANYRITVKEENFAGAVETLKKAGLPREPFRSLGEVFKGDGLVVTPYEQRVRMMYALGQELGRTVTSINGVTQARVHVVVPDLDLRGLPLNKPSASVIAHHRPGIDAAELTSKIRMIVSSGVQGLDFRNVSVALFPMPGTDGATPAQERSETTALRPNARPVSMMLESGMAPPASSGSFLTSLLWVIAILMGGGGLYLTLAEQGRRRLAEGNLTGRGDSDPLV
jgi:type III secretion protein J